MSHPLVKQPSTQPTRLTGINKLSLVNFRNYAAADFDFSARHIVLTGPNGAGKTNILEAISLLTPGRGFRNVAAPALIRQGSDVLDVGFRIDARLCNQDHNFTMATSLASKNQKRKAFIDHSPVYKQAELAACLRANWLLPQMDRLFLDGQSARRRFLDRMVYGFNPEHAAYLNAYEALVRQRQKLLLDFAPDQDWITVLEARMARRAVQIIAARNHLIDLLNARCSLEGPLAGGDDFPALMLSGEGKAEELCAHHNFGVGAEQALQEAYQQSRLKDKESRRTHIGPQRFHINLRHLNNGLLVEYCSTGEQKILLISLILGQMMSLMEHQGPLTLLLLDEIAAHLDKKRRVALFERLQAIKLQVFYTGTDAAVFDELNGNAQFFMLEKN